MAIAWGSDGSPSLFERKEESAGLMIPVVAPATHGAPVARSIAAEIGPRRRR